MRLQVISAVMSLVLMLAGCSERTDTIIPTESAAPDPTTERSDQTEQSEQAGQTEQTEQTEELPEMSYMEKCTDMITEMPPEEILEERDGIVYPEFEKHTYYSQTAQRETPVNVLLPADYSEDRKYPVLYILHGYYDTQDWMARDIVHISTMLTNLVADGEAEEMIVVLPYIYCSAEMPYCTGMDAQNTLNYDNFINDLTTDLMPFIEENFSVAEGRENTAVTGFSMGGRESLFIGFSLPERFGYIGAVCAAPGLVEGTGDPWQLKKDQLVFEENAPELLLLSAAVNDGVVGGNPATYEKLMTKLGTEHLWHTMSSTGHDHTSVTPHLYNFMRMIFKAE